MRIGTTLILIEIVFSLVVSLGCMGVSSFISLANRTIYNQAYAMCLAAKNQEYAFSEAAFQKMLKAQITIGMTLDEVAAVFSCSRPRKLGGQPNAGLIVKETTETAQGTNTVYQVDRRVYLMGGLDTLIFLDRVLVHIERRAGEKRWNPLK